MKEAINTTGESKVEAAAGCISGNPTAPHLREGRGVEGYTGYSRMTFLVQGSCRDEAGVTGRGLFALEAVKQGGGLWSVRVTA